MKPDNTQTTFINAYQKWLSKNAASLFDELPFGYLVIMPNRKIAKINACCLEWLGMSAEAVLYHLQFKDLITVGGRIFHETHHLPLERMNGKVNEINYTILGKNKKRTPVLVNTQQEKSADGTLIFTQYFLFNISDRKSYEKELLIAKKNAEQAAEAKDQFIATVSHEIRTPLHGIISTTDLLSKHHLLPKQKELLNILQYSTQNLLALINDVLDFSKNEADKNLLSRDIFNIKEVVQNHVDLLLPKALEKGLLLELAIPEDLPDYLLGDALRLGQILNNLLGNAIKFTRIGSVKMLLRLAQRTATTTQIYFEVADTGMGIAESEIDLIFTPFAQGKNAIQSLEKGTGLGLAITKGLVELHHTTLHVSSQLGQGTRFYFTIDFSLPTQKEIDEITAQPIESTVGSLANYHILLAEDNPTNTYLASLYFDKWQLRYDIAEDGQEAVEMAQKSTYDLILMDLRMPILDGYAATKAIRALGGEFEKIPIIAITASVSASVKDKVTEAGMDLLITKPFRQDALHQIILKALPNKNVAMPIESTHFNPADHVDIYYLYEYFDKDKPEILSFIEIVLEDLTNIKTEIVAAIRAEDAKAYADARHKTISALKLFKAIQLEKLLIDGKGLLENKTLILDSPIFTILETEYNGVLQALAYWQAHLDDLE